MNSQDTRRPWARRENGACPASPGQNRAHETAAALAIALSLASLAWPLPAAASDEGDILDKAQATVVEMAEGAAMKEIVVPPPPSQPTPPPVPSRQILGPDLERLVQVATYMHHNGCSSLQISRTTLSPGCLLGPCKSSLAVRLTLDTQPLPDGGLKVRGFLVSTKSGKEGRIDSNGWTAGDPDVAESGAHIWARFGPTATEWMDGEFRKDCPSNHYPKFSWNDPQGCSLNVTYEFSGGS